jgi:3-dehydroquinate dehydratase/shikimate dehydrogenase
MAELIGQADRMKLIISIAPHSMNDARKMLRELRHSRDLVEIRIDHIKDLDIEALLRPPRPRVIVTNRHRAEGGRFNGSAETQLRTLSSAMEAGAEFADIELRWGIRQIRRLLSTVPASRLIVSYHDTTRTPSNLRQVVKRLSAAPVKNLKLVTSANDINDNKAICDILTRSRRAGRHISAFCMNERGQISRILGARYGSAFTYASSGMGEPTAPGQLSANDLKTIYRVERINSNTRLFGLVGNPVSHSKGYRFHNGVFARKSLNAVYVNFLVDDVRTFFKTFREEISGLSITMPFKRAVIPLLDRVDEDALTLQSVNTIVAKRGRLAGSNTDFRAIRKILAAKTRLRGKKAVILGTGATASTMAYAAIEAGASATIVGRSAERAREAAARLNCDWATFEDLPGLTADILFNGTPVGMAGHLNRSPVPGKFLRKGMTVFDAVHYPPVTLLLRRAKSAGCQIITGTELFEEQANLQSKLFLEVC